MRRTTGGPRATRDAAGRQPHPERPTRDTSLREIGLRTSATVEYPTGSGQQARLRDVASDLARRLVSIWLPAADGRRPVYGTTEKFQRDPEWRDLLLFNEYFHGDTGAGLGASHQTGWTGIVARLLCRGGVLDEAGRQEDQEVERRRHRSMISAG